MRRFALLIVCCLLLGALRAEGAPLSGIAEWRYGGYRAEQGGRTVLDGSYFSQQYSLLYEKQGQFLDGRGGRYDLALGGEWTGVASEVNGETVDIDTAKIFYRGDLLLAPGGLPFRLHLFSNDMHRTSLVADYLIDAETPVITPNLINNLNNGQHIVTGATLLVGIRNGSYRGHYRDVLSQFPKLLVDYQEQYVRNLESRTPQHYRDRNLAFVSLNKKDNWFHYRLRDYQDFENPRQDFEEKTYMLGTVDHQLVRQWINLTNWMRISADGSYTESDQFAAVNEAGERRAPQQRYDLNLFSTARRSNWDAATFTTFSRRRESDDLTKDFEIPFMANGEFSRNAAWRFNFLASRSRRDISLLDAPEDRDIVYAATRLEMFRRGRFILVPHFAVENKSGDTGEGSAVRAGLEYYSNRAFKSRHNLFGAYTLARFAGSDRSGGNVDYWEQELTGRIDSRVTSRLRIGIEERLLYGSGALDKSVSEQIAPQGSRGLVASGSESQPRGEELLRSTTTWFGEYAAASRLTNRLELIYDYLSADGAEQDQIVLKHSLRYDRRALQASMRNEAVFGDAQQESLTESTTLGVGTAVASPDFTYSHSSDLHYSPGRAWEAGARLEYDGSSGDGAETSRLRFTQTSQYNLFTVNGLVRKLADIREELEFERLDSSSTEPRKATFLTMSGNYFPTRRLLLGAKVRYRLFSSADAHDLATFLTAGLNFEKLIVSLDYAYGTRSGTDLIPAQKEHRWEMNVKKIF